MEQKRQVASILMIMLIFLGIYSCGTPKKQVHKRQKSSDIFVYGDEVQKEASYADIQGSVARLRAILCGKFVHYSVGRDPKREKYTPWLVNENQDSVLHFYVPVGDYRKDGYWVYHYQCLTSLIDNPISETFFKLQSVNRDSITATFYTPPKDFSKKITEIVKDPRGAFKEVNFKKMKLSSNSRVIYYVRQTPLKYLGESNLNNAKNPKNKDGYEAFYYTVNIGKIEVGVRGYNKDKAKIGESKPEWLVKEAMINTKWLGL